MNWAGKQHPIESAVEWLASIALALAVGWASWRVGLPIYSSLLAGTAALVAGFAAFRLGGRGPSGTVQQFQPATFESVTLDELVLEESDAVLELHDRLEMPCPDSRVVRLFERQEPTPGELVDRIVDFLADGRRQEALVTTAVGPSRLPDASAALHDALANIRASLR